jgi:hypothetical protein
MACGGMTAGLPAGPSTVAANVTTAAAPVPAPAPAAAQDFPNLTGRWRTSGQIGFRNLENGNVLTWGSCSGALTIDAQDGAAFSGPIGTQGGGWNSDRFCTAYGTFRGQLLARDGSVAQARLEGNFQNWPFPSVSPACETIASGDGVWTGSATSEAITLQVRDTLRCAVNVDGGLPTLPMANFERTVTLRFERW